MRTFNELNSEEQKKAIAAATNEFLTAILDGSLSFNDDLNEDDLQQRIDSAIARANSMHTPWFASEYLMEDEYVADNIRGMASSHAEDAFYPDKGENVIYL